MDKNQTGPLSGYRILDLTVMTAGPVGTVLLADLGADVIKVEEPRAGDLSRNLGNQFVGGESVQFLSQNRNKRSIRLDLKSPKGRDAFLRMAEHADVVVENFRPGTVERLGIGYDAVKAVNPKIVYASVSAFGQSGPYAAWPANDPIVQAVAGLMDMTGEAGGNPVRLGAPLPDFGAAALLAFGISTALLHRERHGVGQKIDTSLLSAALFSTIPRDGETLRSGKAPERLGSGHPTMVPYRNYQGADGHYFFAACFTEKFWQNLCHALDREDLLSDERFIGNTARTANRHALDALLEQEFLRHPADHWVAHLSAADVPCAKVQDYHTALTLDPQIQHNGTVVELDHPRAGKVTNIASPVNFHGSPVAYRRPPPVLGEHTVEVLLEFGFSDDEIAVLEGRTAGLQTEKKEAVS
ncbi:CoA transferase [Burkholderia sp. SRS-W-2-2016]|uniref:CaiB/BaiF CoA transferase family protein n=1 Tax=Burkholderia sp. SRS-W-2-2016 TaxID=1926878 RepID=UPI00094AB3EC|nr:CoA transferase [Burkholderia sp. SRS-W-2-2016]OLL29198.1 CoA transferase [Burkholderia sp. SRS-W-2-2016]